MQEPVGNARQIGILRAVEDQPVVLRFHVQVGVLRTIRVKPGCQSRFEALMREYSEQVVVWEPGCIVRTMMRSPSDPCAYTVHEQYLDDASWEAHQVTAHRTKYRPAIHGHIESIERSRFDIGPK